MKPSVTLSESTPTSPQKYPTSLRNRCLCVVLFFEANKLQKKWSKTNTAREQDIPLAILQVKLRHSCNESPLNCSAAYHWVKSQYKIHSDVYLIIKCLLWNQKAKFRLHLYNCSLADFRKNSGSPWSSILWSLYSMLTKTFKSRNRHCILCWHMCLLESTVHFYGILSKRKQLSWPLF